MRILPAVAIAEADDVAQLGGRDLGDHAVLERLHLMDGSRRNVARVSRREDPLLERVLRLADAKEELALHHVNRLGLDPMVLEREALAGADVEELPESGFDGQRQTLYTT